MADLLDLLQGQLSNDAIHALSQHTGINDDQKTANATNAIMAFLTNALAKNTATPHGANALLGALDRDHDGSVLDDVIGLVTGNISARHDSNALNGIGILGHIFGAKQNLAIEAIARMTGLHKNQTAMLMVRLAPMVLGMLGKKKKEENLRAPDLSDLLGNSVAKREPVERSMISKILDRDGDGNVMDEIGSMGMKVLGNYLFR